MRVLLGCSIGGSGHLMPLLEVARGLRDQGHECVVLMPRAPTDDASASGFRFLIGDQPPEAVIDEIWARVKRGPPEEVVGVIDREVFAELATDAMLDAAQAACADFAPHLVVRESCEYATAIAAHRAGIPQAQVAISAAAIEAAVLQDVSESLELRCPGVSESIRRAPYLTAFPEPLDPSSWPETRRYREPPRSPGALPQWWPGIENRPLVYVTFGTVLSGLDEAPSVYRTALDAVAELPIRVLMTVGRRYDPESLDLVPTNTHIEPWVPQADVFAAADLVVCHGGSGTTNGALAAGLPLVVCPLFADQSRNANTVERLGAGRVVRSQTPPDGGVGTLGPGDVPVLSTAIRSCLQDPRYRETARRAAAMIAAASTLAETLHSLTAGHPR